VLHFFVFVRESDACSRVGQHFFVVNVYNYNHYNYGLRGQARFSCGELSSLRRPYLSREFTFPRPVAQYPCLCIWPLHSVWGLPLLALRCCEEVCIVF
jgi:hypothetical protein